MSTDRTIDVDGAHVHYVDDGAGPVLLLLHGNPTSSFLYRHVIAGLRDRFRCVAPDYPGFGRSVAPPRYGFTPREHSRVVERFVDALGLRDLTLFVQDWGARSASAWRRGGPSSSAGSCSGTRGRGR
jgi:haloalkane dehalogenase